MSDLPDLRAAAEQIEALLRDLERTTDERTFARMEDLLRAVVHLYGAALARAIELVRECDGAFERLASDGLVSSLMHVHGLHPDSVAVRVERALQKVRPLLAQHGGGVELLQTDENASAVLLRLEGSCSGCPSSLDTLRHAVERAVLEEAPEILIIDVERDEPAGVAVGVDIGPKPQYQECPPEMITPGVMA